MATIALHANKLNQMPELIKDVKKAVMDYKTELSTLKTKVMTIDSSVCDLYDVISSIQASTQTQEDKIESLENLQQNSEEFISEVMRIDGDVDEIVRKRKEDFYEKYEYLKPECEKGIWEKAKDTCKKVGEWCKENWQSIVKIVVTVVIVVALGIATLMTGGVLSLILAGAFWGALSGTLIGGIAGGVTSMANGGSFLEGFADGALSGAVSGAITGAVFAGLGVGGSALGTYLGGSCKYIESADKILKVLQCTSKVTKVLSIGMDGFDTIALVAGIFNPNSLIVQLNEKLHSSKLYNAFQIGVNALAIFTGAASSSMNARMQQGPPACFIAGTMVLTTMGLVAIENIKAGDKVISTNEDTFETAEKTVVETYVREVTKLVHLTINNELIITTVDHPFYVKEYGFINAGELLVGDKVVNANGETCLVENVHVEITEVPETVYNFQVEDFHTYHVGNGGILVHNADYLSPKQMNQYKQDVLSGKDIRFKTRENAVEFIQKKFPHLKQEIAGSRSANGWHFDSHPINGSLVNIEHINLYSKLDGFRIHITWGN